MGYPVIVMEDKIQIQAQKLHEVVYQIRYLEDKIRVLKEDEQQLIGSITTLKELNKEE